jgi:hypothetical protein
MFYYVVWKKILVFIKSDIASTEGCKEYKFSVITTNLVLTYV